MNTLLSKIAKHIDKLGACDPATSWLAKQKTVRSAWRHALLHHQRRWLRRLIDRTPALEMVRGRKV